MKFTNSFTVRIYECEADGKLKLTTLLDYMQEIAALHTIQLKITIPDILPLGLTWMLSRYHIVVESYPHYGDAVTISTWVARHEGMFSVREYQLSDSSGRILASATSSWVLYDFKRKKIVPVAERLPLENILPERAVADEFPSLPIPKKNDNERAFHVRMHDLDINEHANNRVIVEWGLEAVPADLIKTSTLREIEITFKGQAFYGNRIVAQSQILPGDHSNKVLILIKNLDSDKAVAVLRTNWKKARNL